MVINNVGTKSNSGSDTKLWVTALIVLVLAYIPVRYLFPMEQGEALEPMNTLGAVLIPFLFAMMLKIDYTKAVFILLLLIGLVFISVFTFTQGLLTVLLALFVLKLLKVL